MSEKRRWCYLFFYISSTDARPQVKDKHIGAMCRPETQFVDNASASGMQLPVLGVCETSPSQINSCYPTSTTFLSLSLSLSL